MKVIIIKTLFILLCLPILFIQGYDDKTNDEIIESGKKGCIELKEQWFSTPIKEQKEQIGRREIQAYTPYKAQIRQAYCFLYEEDISCISSITTTLTFNTIKYTALTCSSLLVNRTKYDCIQWKLAQEVYKYTKAPYCSLFWNVIEKKNIKCIQTGFLYHHEGFSSLGCLTLLV